MIEAWGRGFDNIKSACEIYDNAPLPEYTITESGVMVLCKPSERYIRLNNIGSTNANDKATSFGIRNDIRNEFDTRNGIRNEFGIRNDIRNEFSTGNSTRKKDNHLMLITLIQNNPFITTAKMSELASVSQRTVYRILSKLREDDIIDHIGPTKKGQWVINEQKLSEWHKKWFV